MPGGIIDDQQNVLYGVLLGQFSQENVRAFRARIGHDQRKEIPIYRRYSMKEL